MTVDAMPYTHLGDALATDYFGVREQFTEEQWDHFLATRRFVDSEVLPVINEYWETAELPWPLMRRLAELELLGEDIAGYGCPGMSPLARGLQQPAGLGQRPAQPLRRHRRELPHVSSRGRRCRVPCRASDARRRRASSGRA